MNTISTATRTRIITITIPTFKSRAKSHLSINSATNHIKNWVISHTYTNIVKTIFKLNNQSLNSKHITHYPFLG